MLGGSIQPNPISLVKLSQTATGEVKSIAERRAKMKVDTDIDPKANFTCDLGDVRKIQCDATRASDEDGSIENYEWSFGGSGTVTDPGSGRTSGSDLNNIVYQYDSPGTYSISLKVTDDDGNSDQNEKEFTVGKVDYSITLNSGISFFSTPAKTLNRSWMVSQGCSFRSGSPSMFTEGENNWVPTNQVRYHRGYRANLSSSCTLNFESFPKEFPSQKGEVTLRNGWNLISVSNSQSWNDIKGDCQLSDKEEITLQKSKTETKTVQENEDMKGTKAYYVKVIGSCSLYK